MFIPSIKTSINIPAISQKKLALPNDVSPVQWFSCLVWGQTISHNCGPWDPFSAIGQANGVMPSGGVLRREVFLPHFLVHLLPARCFFGCAFGSAKFLLRWITEDVWSTPAYIVLLEFEKLILTKSSFDELDSDALQLQDVDVFCYPPYPAGVESEPLRFDNSLILVWVLTGSMIKLSHIRDSVFFSTSPVSTKKCETSKKSEQDWTWHRTPTRSLKKSQEASRNHTNCRKNPTKTSNQINMERT